MVEDTEGLVAAAASEDLEGAPTEGLRARRRRLMRDELARIAVRLFVEQGYDKVSVGEIAAEAGMSERSFFRYFASKDEVLRRYQRTLNERLLGRLRARPESEEPLRALRNAYAETSQVSGERRRAVHQLGVLLADVQGVWASEMGATVFDESVVAELARRMDVPSDDLRPTVLAAAVSAAAAVGWNRWVGTDGADEPRDFVLEAIDELGLGPAR